MTPRRWILLAAIACVGIGVGGFVAISVLDHSKGASSEKQISPETMRLKTLEEENARLHSENKRLTVERDESQRDREKAQAQLSDLQNDRTQLLDRLKSMTQERNTAQTEVGQLREELVSIEGTMTRILAEEATRLRQDVSRLQGEPLAPPPTSVALPSVRPPAALPATDKLDRPELEKFKKAYQREVEETRKDMDHVFERERKAFRQQIAEKEKQLQAISSQKGAGESKVKRMESELKEMRSRLLDAETDSKKKRLEIDGEWHRKLKASEDALVESKVEAKAISDKYEKARVEMEQLRSSLHRDWAQLYIRLGALEAIQGNAREAEEALLSAIELDSSLGVAHYNLAVLYDDYLNDTPRAIREYEQYLLLTPKAKDAKTVQGWVSLLKGEQSSRSKKDQWNRPGIGGIARTFKQLLQ